MAKAPALRLAQLLLGLLILGPGPAHHASAELRIATWNIFSTGAPFSPAHVAARLILERIDPDVLALNEAGLPQDVIALANELGFPHVVIGTPAPLAGHINALLSHYPLSSTIHSAQGLSGSALANDLNTHPISAIVTTPLGPIGVVVCHFKASAADSGEFQRAVEAMRIGQVIDSFPADLRVVVLGDLNQRIDLLPLTPAIFYQEPEGMPLGYRLGPDIGMPIENDPFEIIALNVLDTPQILGLGTMRWGARLDYVLLDPDVQAIGQTYDSEDDGLPQALALAGSPLPASTSDTASDHLLVFADVHSLPEPSSRALLIVAAAVVIALQSTTKRRRSRGVRAAAQRQAIVGHGFPTSPTYTWRLETLS